MRSWTKERRGPPIFICNKSFICPMRTIFIFLASFLLSFSGAAQQNCTNCGVALRGVRLYKPERNAYILPVYERDTKYFFYDSTMIFERHAISFKYDAQNRETWRRDVIGYTFVDFRTRKFYDYRHFSDTARVMRLTPRIRENHGFYTEGYFGGKLRMLEKPVPLLDTVLNGVKCSRLRGIFTKNGDTTLIETMYYVPEAERSMAYDGKTMVDGKKYSVIRTDDFDVASGLKTYNFMDIVSRNLTKQELKVFAAWKRNAKANPVKR